MREDSVLQQEGGLTVTESTGGLFSSIPEKNIKVVAAYLQLITDLSSGGKDVKVLDIFINAKTIFTDAYIKSTDIYWKEHLAATLRDPFDGAFEAKLYNALKLVPKRTDDPDAGNFHKSIKEIKDFLNDLAHMRYGDALKYVQGKYPESTEITEEVFSKICKDMIDVLFEWFSKHCYKGTN